MTASFRRAPSPASSPSADGRGGRRCTTGGAFERAFAASEPTPRIAVSLPHFLAVPALLAGSRLAAIVPRPLADSLARAHPISIHELPYPTIRLQVRSLWYERHEVDAAQEWLHDVMRSATEPLRIGSINDHPG